MSDHRFQVDLGGVIELLSRHLYEDDTVFVRELLQNAVDALAARPGTKAPITFELISGGDESLTLSVRDEGIGLTEDEVHRFLATIGTSSKRDRQDQDSFLGRFGVGLLSCFAVAEEIVLVSRSAQDPDAPAVEWHGRENGSYTLRTIEREVNPGTTVHLRAKPESKALLERTALRDQLKRYGRFLDARIELHAEGTVSRIDEAPPWRAEHPNPEDRRAAILDWGQAELGWAALDGVELWDPEGFFEGVALVLPHAASPNRRGTHRVYLRGMLVSDRLDDLLPSWAFFLSSVLDVRGLTPTASRHGFVQDAAMRGVRDRLDRQLRGWLMRLAREDSDRFQSLIATHILAIKALAVEDEEFFDLIVDWLTVDSSQGRVSLGDLRRSNEEIAFLSTVDEFRQVAAIASAHDRRILNAGYVYDRELIEKLADRGAAVRRLDVSDLVESMGAPTAEEAAQLEPLVDLAIQTLQPFGVGVQASSFAPESMVAQFLADRDTQLRRTIDQAQEDADELWSGVLGDLDGAIANTQTQLCLNARNPLVPRLASLIRQQPQLVQRSVQLLYVQALLMSHHPLREQEHEILSRGLGGLIEIAAQAAERE